MTVAIDTSVLLFLLNEKTSAPIDPTTGLQVQNCKDRVRHLVSSLEKSKERLIVPTPALSEVLVRAEVAGPHYLAILEKQRAIRVVDFNKIAAVEAAAVLAHMHKVYGKPSGGDARAKLKFDVMIFATARVFGATTIYSDDSDIRRIGSEFGMAVTGIKDLPLPPQSSQMDIFAQSSPV